ncbi:RNase H type-1 domain-containing protein [Balamuthia mandrillaris]
MSDIEKKAKRMRTLTRVAKVEYAAEGERGTRAWLWHNFLTNGRCLVGQQQSLVITNPRKERLMNAIRCGGLPIGKKWRAIQQSEEDSMCPACNAEEETAEHFLLICPNLWEDRFRIWNVDNGDEEQVRKLIIEDCTTKLLSSGKKCNRAQEMEHCKQSCKRVWRLWAARASWKYGSIEDEGIREVRVHYVSAHVLYCDNSSKLKELTWRAKVLPFDGKQLPSVAVLDKLSAWDNLVLSEGVNQETEWDMVRFVYNNLMKTPEELFHYLNSQTAFQDAHNALTFNHVQCLKTVANKMQKFPEFWSYIQKKDKEKGG